MIYEMYYASWGLNLGACLVSEEGAESNDGPGSNWKVGCVPRYARLTSLGSGGNSENAWIPQQRSIYSQMEFTARVSNPGDAVNDSDHQGAPAVLAGPLGIFFVRPLWISFWE